jgi:hypothetical protein
MIGDIEGTYRFAAHRRIGAYVIEDTNEIALE